MKVRVLHVIPSFGTGGAERLVVDLIKYADKQNFDVAGVSLYPEMYTILNKEVKENGLHVFYLDKHKGLDISIIPKLRGVFKVFRPDVVHTHLYVLKYVLPAAKLEHVPVIVHTIHNVADKEVNSFGKFLNYFGFKYCGVVPVSISREVAETVHRFYGRGIRSPIIYNGIPVESFSEPSRVYNRAKSENFVRIIHIGRFSPQKNHKLLLEAFSLALCCSSDLRLWLVGDGELRPDVEELANKLGIEDKVAFLGVRSDIPELLAQADIFVLSSNWEGMPLSVLEAMASGKPVIATAVGGVPELVENGTTGILVPPADPDALANAIVSLAKDPEKRASLGAMAQIVAKEQFDISRTARGYEELYIKLLGERR